MFEWAEKYVPYMASIVGALIAAGILFFGDFGKPPHMASVGTLTFGMVIAGFAATQRNMLLGMIGSEVMKFAVDRGFHNDILSYLMDSVYAGIVMSGFSIIGILIFDCSLLWEIWIIGATFLIVLILAFMIRNEMMMARILTRFLEEQNPKKH